MIRLVGSILTVERSLDSLEGSSSIFSHNMRTPKTMSCTKFIGGADLSEKVVIHMQLQIVNSSMIRGNLV